MCLDATQKSDRSVSPSGGGRGRTLVGGIVNLFPEIISINDYLLKMGISVVFISVKKGRKNHIKELNETLFQNEEFKNVKFVIYVEHTVDVSDIKDTMWRFANNFDPKRDSYFAPTLKGEMSEPPLGRGVSGIGLDGTRKTKQYDNFDRPWPNIICADESTIKSVDEKWSKMFAPPLKGEGDSEAGVEFIPSPSIKYRKMLYKGGAVVEE